MDFFAKHYEKLILAFCLILLLFGIVLVALSASNTSKVLSENYQKARRNVEGGNLVDAMNTAKFNLDRYFNDPRKSCSILGDGNESSGKGSMFEAGKMIMCVNPECKRILLLSSDVCPFCGTKQPELSKSTGKDEDTDGDGIPDLEEQKFAFLNYRNPSDATMDQDNDGFLNIEEIKAGTNPEDGSEFPPLALLLRVQHVFKRKLPIKLVEIEKNRSDEMNKWDLVFMAPDPRTRREKRITVRVGETLMNRFKVTSAGFDGEGDAAIPYAVVVSEGPEGEEYTMKLNEVVENRRPTVAFINLMSRSKADVQRHMMRMRVFCNEGQEFVLRKLKGGAAQGEAPAPRGGSEAVVEHYRVIAADVSAKTCQIAMLDAKGGNAVRTFDIPVFDINNGKDFLPEENKREGEMNEPSAEGAAPRPARGRPRPR